ncbi:MAG: hypothetical protein NZ839_01885 [Endomicrobia bacterium]|nr:hypothetical protein [Endomicrobiia bacterium]
MIKNRIKFKWLYCIVTMFLVYEILHTKGVGGYFQIQWGVEDKGYPEFWKPWYNYQFKFWADPFTKTNVYTQLSADSFSKFYLDRAFLRYAPKNFEFLGLIKEERHSLESQLLRVVDQDVASDYYNSKGFRVNVFYPNLQAVLLTSGYRNELLQEWYGKYFKWDNNTRFSRVKVNLLKTDEIRFSIGSSILQRYVNMERFKDVSGNFLDKQFNIRNDVVTFDAHVNFYTKDLYIETAQSSLNNDSHDRLNGSAFACELRNLIVGPINLASKVYNIDKNFRSLLSGRYGERAYEVGKQGWSNEITFFVPQKLINITFKLDVYDSYLWKIEDDIDIRNFAKQFYYIKPKRVVNVQNEIYTELTNGIKLRSVYDILNEKEIFSSYMLELGWETKVLYPKLQLRIKDIGKDITTNYGEKIITALETKLNITDRLQFYIRSLNTYGTKLAKSWYENFIQLRYYIGWDIDFYLEYGNGWDTGNLTYSWVVDYPARTQPQVIKLYIRANLW